MKKILVTLLVLALCTPAMAATVTITDNADGTGTVTVTAEGAVNIVGLGLDIDQTAGGNITGAVVTEATFNIYPDAAHDLEVAVPGSYNYGDGTAIANQDVVGEAAVSNSFAISVGALNGESTAGATGSASVSITVTVDADTTISVQENAIRGGIVLTDGTGEDITNGTAGVVTGTITDVPSECVASTAAFYADWVSFGSPPCWCYAQNCLGDADGLQQGSAKTGFLAVSTNDLTILANAWQIKEPPDGPGVDATGICADFDRLAQGSAKTGFLRVSTNDLTVLANNWQIKEQPDGPGIGDCAGADYNFFVSP